jgi:hypothetical protein
MGEPPIGVSTCANRPLIDLAYQLLLILWAGLAGTDSCQLEQNWSTASGGSKRVTFSLDFDDTHLSSCASTPTAAVPATR